jgi:regulatory protein
MTEQQSDIFTKACDYLSRRDHSEHELKKKLRGKFPEASLDDIDSVLDRLKTLGFQSDKRFTESFIRSKYYAKNGPIKITYELKRKGIKQKVEFDDLDFVDTALRFAKIRYASKLEKYNSYSYEEQMKLKEKMYRGLAGRGFKYPTIKHVIEKLVELN